MANYKNYTQIVTAKGTAVYPHLRSTEVYDGVDSGKYTCGIKLSDADTEKLINTIANEWEMALKTPEMEGKRMARNSSPSLGFHEDKNGDVVFKAKTNSTLRTKAGEIVETTVPIFNKYGKPFDKDVEVGNGSTIQLCLLLRPFYGSNTIYGVQLILKAVRVIDYVPANSRGDLSAGDCGFECEDIEKEAEEIFATEDGSDF